MSEASQKKSILYVDTGDEITSVIARMQDADGKIAAIVLPKRAPSFQSIINIKLLDRAAKKAKKRAVLITSDKTILPLAGAAGMHVARTTESKPYVPDAPKTTPTPGEGEVDPNQPVGELAAKAKDEQDTIDLGDLPDLNMEDDNAKKPKKKKGGIKVPNFNKFRLWLILGGILLVLLIVGWYVAAFVLPRAEITVETTTQNVAETLEFDAVLDLEGVDEENFAIPATRLTYTLEDEASVDTTGEENVGDRASGVAELQNCKEQSGTVTIPSGTRLTSGQYTFITQETVELPERTVQGIACVTPTEEVEVEAENRGADYNISEREYSVEGYSNVNAYGSDMTGGSDEFESVVASRDIRAAREEIEQAASPDAEVELEEMFEMEGLVPILESFEERDSSTSASHDEGDRTDSVTVTLTAEYAMLGVDREDIQELIRLQLGEEFDFDRQSIVDDGLDQATLRVVSQDGDTTRLRLRTIVAIGAEIDTDALADEVAGLSRSETESTIFLRDGVRDVQIDYSPFYVFSTPDDSSKISITVLQEGDEPDDIDELFEQDTEDEETTEEE
jgi:hypothetical protein